MPGEREHKFEPVGQCIYCGSNGGRFPLEDEHIIPFSLGGAWVLPKASCRECSGVTSYFEGYISRNVFWEFRLSQRLRSRRKKDKPNSLPVTVNYHDRTERIEMPLANHPSTIALLEFPMPGLLVGDPPSENWKSVQLRYWTIFQNFPKNAESIRLKLQISNAHFAKFLAKVAHSWAVACWGVNAFRPFLPGIILGKDSNAAYLIGTHPNNLPPQDGSDYLLGVRVQTVGGKDYAICDLRLFPGIGAKVPGTVGTPTYCIVVGEIDYSVHFQKLPPKPKESKHLKLRFNP